MTRLGIEELLLTRGDLLRGRRVGLVSNYTVTDSHFYPVISLLKDSTDCTLAKLFGPEHGVRNSAKEGEEVDFMVDDATGLPAYSLYGPNKKPTPEMLAELDVLIVDLPDIGCRYYTNMNTLAYCMEAAAEQGVPVIVPDRPNPIGGMAREGNILDPKFKSFVGMHPIPNRHGLTVGELAGFVGHRQSPTCDLTVVPMREWTRDQFLTDTGIPFVSPSPNTTSLEMTLLYPGTCLFEGTNLSVGRGTAHPFELLGAPYVKAHQLTHWFNEQHLPGVVGRPVYFVPTYSRYAGELCEGVALHVTDHRALEPVRTGIVLLQGFAEIYPMDFEFAGRDTSSRLFIDLLAGTSALRQLILAGNGLQYLESARGDVEGFNRDIRPFELYQSRVIH